MYIYTHTYISYACNNIISKKKEKTGLKVEKPKKNNQNRSENTYTHTRLWFCARCKKIIIKRRRNGEACVLILYTALHARWLHSSRHALLLYILYYIICVPIYTQNIRIDTAHSLPVHHFSYYRQSHFPRSNSGKTDFFWRKRPSIVIVIRMKI